MQSALTAAIKAGDGAKAQPALEISALVADGSFPCLNDSIAKENGHDVNYFIEIKDIPAVGTAPAAYSLKDGTPAADYEINPFSRRAGKEVDPGSVMSPGAVAAGPASGSVRASLMSEMAAKSISKSVTKIFSFDDKPYVLRNSHLELPVQQADNVDKEVCRQRNV